MSSRGSEILAALLAAGEDDGGLLPRLTDACARALPGTGVGLVLRSRDGPPATVAVAGPRASLAEELQFTVGEGPCVDAVRTGRLVLQPDLGRNGPTRWPAFSAAALDAGIRAVFALPLVVGTIRLGGLDLYRAHVGGLTDAELAEALSFADVATAVLLHPGDDGASGRVAVVEDRAEVHQATGMVSVQAGVPLEQALALLRARAYAAERPVGAVARDVLAGVLTFSEVERPGERGR
ncbi:GAF domain-containing protein [Blastococcus sp. SYSU D00669]